MTQSKQSWLENGSIRGSLIAVLVVIILAGGAFLVISRMNRRLVEAEVNARLGPLQKSLEEVKPVLAEIKSVEVAVRQLRQASGQLDAQQQLETLARKQSALDRKVDSSLKNLAPTVEKIGELENQLATLQVRLGAQSDRIEKILASLDRSGEGIQQGVSELSGRVKTIESTLDENQTIVKELQKALLRSKSPKEIDDSLAAVGGRLKDFESRLGARVVAVEGRAGAIERKLDSLERQLLQLQSQPPRP